MASSSSSSSASSDQSHESIALRNLIMDSTDDHLIITHFDEYCRLGSETSPEILEKVVIAINNEKKKQKEKAEREGRRTINDNRYSTSNEMSNNRHTVFITGNNATTGSISTADAPAPQPIPTPAATNTSRVWDIGSRAKDVVVSLAGVGAETVKFCWQHATPEQLAKANLMEGVAGVATGVAGIMAKKWFW